MSLVAGLTIGSMALSSYMNAQQAQMQSGLLSSQAGASSAKGFFQNEVSKYNSLKLSQEADRVALQGDFVRSQNRQQGRRNIASFRAATGASGVTVNEGSAARVEQSIEQVTQMEDRIIAENYERRVAMLEEEANFKLLEGQMAMEIGNYDAALLRYQAEGASQGVLGSYLGGASGILGSGVLDSYLVGSGDVETTGGTLPGQGLGGADQNG